MTLAVAGFAAAQVRRRIGHLTALLPGATSYQDAVVALAPSLYWPMQDGTLEDASGNARDGTISGVPVSTDADGPTLQGVALRSIDFGGGGFGTLTHSAAYMEAASGWKSTWFYVSTLANGTAVLAKDGSGLDWGVNTQVDAAGRLSVHVQTSRDEWRLETPDGAVPAATWHHIAYSVGPGGLQAWLDGRALECGVPCHGHVYGYRAPVREADGSRLRNLQSLTCAKAGWSGNADVRLCHMVVKFGEELTQAKVNTLADVASTPAALPHRIWGPGWLEVGHAKSYDVDAAPYSAVHDGATNDLAAIQAAIDDASASGGGTVLFTAAANYRIGGTISMKANVRLASKTRGSRAIISFAAGTALGTWMLDTTLAAVAITQNGNIAIDGAAVAVTDAAAIVAGDLVRFQTGNIAAEMYVADWDTDYDRTSAVYANEAWNGELFRVSSIATNTLTFDPLLAAPVISQPLAEGGLDGSRYRPVQNVALVDINFDRPSHSTQDAGQGIRLQGCYDAELLNVRAGKCGANCISFTHSLLGWGKDCDIAGIEAENAFSGGSTASYGYIMLNSKHWTLVDCSGDAQKHDVTHGKSATAGAVTCHTAFINFTATGGRSKQASIDAHAPAYGVWVANGNLSNGLALSGKQHRVDVCAITGNQDALLLIDEGGMDGVFFDVTAPNGIWRWFGSTNAGTTRAVNMHAENCTIAGGGGAASDTNKLNTASAGNTWTSCDDMPSNWSELVAGADAYATTVTGMTGLVAYWRLGDTGTGLLEDASGNGHHGTYPLAPAEFEADELIFGESDGKACDFGGVGYGEIAHDAAFELARGTFFCTIHAPAAALTGEDYIFGKYGAGLTAGDIGLRVFSDGRLRCFTKDGTAQIDLTSQASVIEPDNTYHVVFMWDEISAWLVLDGRMVAWTRDWTVGLVNNTHPWQLGRRLTGPEANFVIDEAGIFNRRLEWSEIDALSEYVRGLGYTTAETTTVVSTTAALEAALAVAEPGEHILVANGTYAGFDSILAASGEKRRPIVVRPQNGAGMATLSAPTFTINARWIVFDGFDIVDPFIRPEGQACRYWRFTRCTFTEMEQTHALQVSGMVGRVDHCDFSGIIESGTTQAIHNRTGTSHGGEIRTGCYNLVDHNYFHDSGLFLTNGKEAWAAGAGVGDSDYWVWCTLYRNLFARWYADQEVTSIKSNGHLLLENTYIDHDTAEHTGQRCGQRHGGLCWFQGEYIEDMGLGMGVRSAHSVAIGCHFDNADCTIWAGDVAGDVFYADATGSGGNAPAAYNCLIIGCTVANGGQITVGQSHSAEFADGTVLRECQNVVLEDEINTTNTGAGTSPVPYTAAIKLTTADVGLTATDPLVPAGWL